MLQSNDQHPCQQPDCSDNLCVICYDNLIQPNEPDKTPFTIPECGHTFHQLCINSWFRQGNEKCPLCNDMGVAASNNRSRIRPYWRVHEDRFSLLNKLSKKKTAPKILVKEINKFKKKQERMKAYKEEYKKWKETKITINNKELTVHELVKEGERKRKIARKQEWELRKFKRAVCEKVNMVPLILVEKKTIN
tara:strand:- start:2183 stop:2758 length:576 start_codon:yes stop_codon:yes gene_type:complete